MKILSIETSCDDTCISIFKVTGNGKNPTFKVLANNSNSQIPVHVPYGGVYPVLAKREHNKNLPIVLEASLKQAKLEKSKKPFDIIAVTYGPGLEMCLWEGIVFAKELAKKWKIPLIPVNHMEGHVLSVFGKNKGKFQIPKIEFPILSLLVSGGHTELVLSKKILDYKIIGETLDDAVGEAFDKAARTLGLPYPGGPQISKLAEEIRIKATQVGPVVNHRSDLCHISLPRPMLKSKDFNFSFSGLKTAVLYLVRDLGGIEKINQETKKKIALEFENAAIECLVYKTQKAIEKYKVKTLIVAGGVAANQHLRNEMKKIIHLTPDLSPSKRGRGKIKLLFPGEGLSGDNSLMIGIAGYLNYVKNKKKFLKTNEIKATGNLRL